MEWPPTHAAARSTIAIDPLRLTGVPSNGHNKEGAMVGEVDGGSDAALKGIKTGDVILDIDTRAI
jgi:S1-C subfamily serine protease